MPLIALHDGERVVSTTLNIDEARQLARGTFTCPGCEEDMHPKRIRATGTQFFAHYAKGNCAHGLGESPAHLRLKEVVHDIAVGAGWTADYEVRIDTPKGIAVIDVLLSHPTREKRKAVEIQLSRQTDAAYQQRTRTYASQGIETLWLTRHAAPARKHVTAVQLWADNAKEQPLDAYLHADTFDTGIREASVEGVRNRPIHIDALISLWLNDELTHYYQLEVNPRVAYTPQGVLAVITDTEHHVWIRTETRKALAQAHRDAKKDLALRKQVKRQVENKLKVEAERRREAREAKVAELRKQRAADEIQAAVERGKERQRAHRLAPAPTPWTDRVQAWLDTPVSDSILNTLDRLTEAYNAGVADGSITPPPEPTPVKPDYGQVSSLEERFQRCIAYCKERGLRTDTASLAHYMGESETTVKALQANAQKNP